MEPDGVHAEQQFILNQISCANTALQRQREELASLVMLHACKRGLFCPVKTYKLSLNASASEHSLHFEKSPSRFTLVNTHAGASVRVALHHQGASGSIRCSCARAECLPVLLKTLCAFNFLD
ncbi:121R [Bovine adenovirus 3]|uniref:121R n=1 Tax=Bovine adenovirus B serotype 3 TaxID=10510 RepID=A0A9W3IMY9_ADEB3|nr:121R [Bovine adenovirus 3]